MTTIEAPTIATDIFIARWETSSATERANYQLFLSELCDVLQVPRPAPSHADDALNAYVFEKPVTFHHPDGTTSTGRIDLYKHNFFVLEAKQGSFAPAAADAPLIPQYKPRRRGTAVRGTIAWDDAMLRARGQAEAYVRALPNENPPFIVVVDVGHSIELYSDFSRLGKTYTPYPDALSHRIFLRDLGNPKLRERLTKVWTDPLALDPSRRTARVTREIAAQLAELAKSLEKTGHHPEIAATFLMRCLFTLFAEDVSLIKDHAFTALLESIRPHPDHFPHLVRTVWKEMDTGDFSVVLRQKLLRFNGGLFEHSDALPLTAEQLELLISAAKADWHDVEPAIFGTLLERALSPIERHKLGAHYTPRAYVERLVLPTIIEPLREDWSAVQAAAVTLAKAGKTKEAVTECRDFLKKLCNTTVLDPACGTGNFLYVTLEHLKRLEGEIRDQLKQFGESQQDLEHVGLTVDPHQLRGIELNPRAAAIADLVLWIGYLQWHFKTHGNTAPAEPVLKAFHNIECRDAVLAYDKKELATDEHGKPLSRWDGRTTKKHPITGEDVPDESAQAPVWKYINPRKAEWPKADFVIGNPPFLGNFRMREVLGEGYTRTLRATHNDVPESSDYVMYWWSYAATLTAMHDVRRFGFIASNSLRQTYNRKVLQSFLDARSPIHLVYATPDHPWVDSEDGAAVRIAMAVAQAGLGSGVLAEVVSESPGQNEGADVHLTTRAGEIAADLTVGASVASAAPLLANSAICSRGVSLHGSGFIVSQPEAQRLGLGRDPAVEKHIRQYLNGKDLTRSSRTVMVIDLFGLTVDECRTKFPALYQWVYDRVKPERDARAGVTADADQYAENWWLFGKPRPELRRALTGLNRYTATVETAKHRVFVLLDHSILPDNMLVTIALSDASCLGVLSSRIHVAWAIAAGGTLEDRPRYNKTRCFDPFPFPDCTEAQKQKIRELGEALDAHRKRQQTLHPDLTLTDMYNVLEKLRSLDVFNQKSKIKNQKSLAFSAKEKTIHEHGLISVLKQIHDDLDAAVFDAYGWPANLTDEQILEKLVVLNKLRAEEESRGIIRYLRPEFQNPSAAKLPVQQTLDLPEAAPQIKPKAPKSKTPWPASLPEQAKAIRAALATQSTPTTPADLAKLFTRANAARIEELLQTLVSLAQARQLPNNKYLLQ